MSYRLLKVHWVKYHGEKKIRDLYSYHRSDNEVPGFLIRLERRNKKRANLFHYSIGCKGFVKVSGTLANKVSHSEFGIWHREEKQPA